MTNRRFAQLCAQGKLEWTHSPSNSGVVYHEYLYVCGEEDLEVTNHVTKSFDGEQDKVQSVLARTHDELEWHEPKYFDNFNFEN